MNLQYFPQFIRINFPGAALQSNEQINALGEEFKKYLQDKFSNKPDKLETIWNIDPLKVLQTKFKDQLSVNGYHPALIIHFTDFIKKMMAEEEQETT